ncbi:hypothetical protein Tsubulata_044462 [Turnera subulata]|uniref:Clavata3/ESR (CLE) gene family member n=1 Tax=Turnera subulata TaxID=218843 RepID=A0A9Q0JBF2_9ROSI|nr:hypothetical protein Tsubulata_044462 [Turnera subulata]
MNHFRICCLIFFFLVLFSSTPRSQAIRRSSFSAPSTTTSQQVFRSTSGSGFHSAAKSKEFESQKRKVPTGSNPLHNKR